MPPPRPIYRTVVGCARRRRCKPPLRSSRRIRRRFSRWGWRRAFPFPWPGRGSSGASRARSTRRTDPARRAALRPG